MDWKELWSIDLFRVAVVSLAVVIAYDQIVVRVMRRALRRMGFKYRFWRKYE